jgi:hypothetical protein
MIQRVQLVAMLVLEQTLGGANCETGLIFQVGFCLLKNAFITNPEFTGYGEENEKK